MTACVHATTGTMYTVLVIIGVSTYSCTITIAEVIRCTVKLFMYSQLYEFDGIIHVVVSFSCTVKEMLNLMYNYIVHEVVVKIYNGTMKHNYSDVNVNVKVLII